MSLFKWFAVGTMLALAWTPNQVHAQGVEYDVTVLGKVPGSYLTYARGMNDHGEVVGMAIFIPGGLKAWLWTADTGFVLMPQPPGLTDYGAVDINEAGVIAGDGGGDSGDVWRYANGAYEILGVLPGTAIPHTEAINELGSIAGTCFGNQFYNPRHSFIAVVGSPLESVLDNSEAYDINDFDQVTGRAPGNVAYRSTPGVGIDLLPPLGDRFLTAGYAINNDGHVVGVAASTVEHSSVPFLYTDSEGMREIGDFGGRAFASDVNEGDEVIGEWEPFSPRRPWVWSESRGVRFLNDVIPSGLGLALRSALAINDNGQILCDARDANSEIVQVLLSPHRPPSGPPSIRRRSGP